MKRIRNTIRHFYTLAMLTALACVAASCVTEAGDCQPETPAQKEVFQLRFKICSRIADSNSRAEDDNTIEDGAAAENLINVKDIVYYLFRKDRTFLLQLKPEVTVTTKLNDSYAIYEVTAKIGKADDPTDYFKSRWNSQVDFYILAMANYSGYTSTMPKPAADQTLDDFMDGKTTVTTALPDTEKILYGTSYDAPDGKSLIPMAGLQLFSVNGSWFETQAGEVPIDLTFITGKQLGMLRSMAKLEVTDMINHKAGTVYDLAKEMNAPRIAEVTIDGIMKDAILLPTANQWNYNDFSETRQVQNPTVSGSGYVTPETTGSTLKFYYDERETQRRADKCPVYSCYVWEYSKGEIAADKTPRLNVTVRNAIDPTTQTPVSPDETYTLPLLTDMKPDAQAATPIPALLRNHIYRYEISAVQSELKIKWEVCSMDDAETKITFN